MEVGSRGATDRVERQKLYAKGGIFSVTSRILVVDLLTSITPQLCNSIYILN